MEVLIDKCEWCGAPLERARTGRRRRFCNTACRVAAHRAKQEVEWEPVEPIELPDIDEPVFMAMTGKSVPPDDQVFSAILALSTCEVALARLARECRPEFAWRCAGLSEAIADARRKFFEGVLP